MWSQIQTNKLSIRCFASNYSLKQKDPVTHSDCWWRESNKRNSRNYDALIIRRSINTNVYVLLNKLNVLNVEYKWVDSYIYWSRFHSQLPRWMSFMHVFSLLLVCRFSFLFEALLLVECALNFVYENAYTHTLKWRIASSVEIETVWERENERAWFLWCKWTSRWGRLETRCKRYDSFELRSAKVN